MAAQQEPDKCTLNGAESFGPGGAGANTIMHPAYSRRSFHSALPCENQVPKNSVSSEPNPRPRSALHTRYISSVRLPYFWSKKKTDQSNGNTSGVNRKLSSEVFDKLPESRVDPEGVSDGGGVLRDNAQTREVVTEFRELELEKATAMNGVNSVFHSENNERPTATSSGLETTDSSGISSQTRRFATVKNKRSNLQLQNAVNSPVAVHVHHRKQSPFPTFRNFPVGRFLKFLRPPLQRRNSCPALSVSEASGEENIPVSGIQGHIQSPTRKALLEGDDSSDCPDSEFSSFSQRPTKWTSDLELQPPETAAANRGCNSSIRDKEAVEDNCKDSLAEGCVNRTPRPSPPPEFSNDFFQIREADHEYYRLEEGNSRTGNSHSERKTQISSSNISTIDCSREQSIRKKVKKAAPRPPLLPLFSKTEDLCENEKSAVISTEFHSKVKEDVVEYTGTTKCINHESESNTQTIGKTKEITNTRQTFRNSSDVVNTLKNDEIYSGPERNHKLEVKVTSCASIEKGNSCSEEDQPNKETLDKTNSQCGTYNLVSTISCNDNDRRTSRHLTSENIDKDLTKELFFPKHNIVDDNNNSNGDSSIKHAPSFLQLRGNAESSLTERSEDELSVSVRHKQHTQLTASDLSSACAEVNVLGNCAANKLRTDNHNNNLIRTTSAKDQLPPSCDSQNDIGNQGILQNSDECISKAALNSVSNVYTESNVATYSRVNDIVSIFNKQCAVLLSADQHKEEHQKNKTEANEVNEEEDNTVPENRISHRWEENSKNSNANSGNKSVSVSETPKDQLADGYSRSGPERRSNYENCADFTSDTKLPLGTPKCSATKSSKDLPQLKVIIHNPTKTQTPCDKRCVLDCTSTSAIPEYSKNNFDETSYQKTNITTNYSNITGCSDENPVNFVSVNGSNNFSDLNEHLGKIYRVNNLESSGEEVTEVKECSSFQHPAQSVHVAINGSNNFDQNQCRVIGHHGSIETCLDTNGNRVDKVIQLQIQPKEETLTPEIQVRTNTPKENNHKTEGQNYINIGCLINKTAEKIQKEGRFEVLLKEEHTRPDCSYTNDLEFENKTQSSDVNGPAADAANNNLFTDANKTHENNSKRSESSFMGPTSNQEFFDLGEISCGSSPIDLAARDINECYNVKLAAPEEVIVAGFHDFCQTMLSVEETPLDEIQENEVFRRNGSSIQVNIKSDSKVMQHCNGINHHSGQVQNLIGRPHSQPTAAPFVRSVEKHSEQLKKTVGHVPEGRGEISSDNLLEEIQNSKFMEKKINVDDPSMVKVLRTSDKGFLEVTSSEINNTDKNSWSGLDSKRQGNVILEIKNAPRKNSKDDKIQSDNLIEEVLLKDIKKIIQNSVDMNSPSQQTGEKGIAVRISGTNTQNQLPNTQPEPVKNSTNVMTLRTNHVNHMPQMDVNEMKHHPKISERTDVEKRDFKVAAYANTKLSSSQANGTSNFASPVNNATNVSNSENHSTEMKKVNTDVNPIADEPEVNSTAATAAARRPLRVSVDADERGPSGQDIVAFHNRTSPCSVDSGTSSHNQGYFVVVAIDFGTTYSGYAFSFTRDPENIHMMKKWDGGDPGVFNQKTPTTLLLTPDGAFHSFGYSARDFYHDLDSEEAKQWMYFDKFKMALHNNEHLSLETEIKAGNGKPMLAVSVFAHALRYFKEQALQELSDQSATKILNEDLRWVVTVPAIWKQPAKQFMRAAAYKAGIASAEYSDQLLIALEPEAASIYCRKMRLHHLVPTEVQGQRDSLLMKHDEHSHGQEGPTLGDKGTRYMVVDCGGGTVDVTVHEVLDSHGTLKELQRASGGPYGSVGVDLEFEKLLIDIFGGDFIQQFKMKRPTGYVDLMIAFEARKRNASPYKDNPLNISLPFSFIDYFKKSKGISVEAALKKSSHKDVRWSQGMLRLEKSAMASLFTKTVNQIRDHIGSIISIPELNIDYLFLVGGFAESLILQKEIKDAFSSKLKVVVPQGVSLAILKGAVLFGLDPTIVNVRRLRMTYGVGVLNRFIHGVHPPEKLVVKDGIQWCADIFDKFVVTDQSVGVGDVIVRSYTPAKAGQSCSVIHMYCSEKDNVYFITDSGVKRCATLILDLSDNRFVQSREIQTRMMFGDTEIKVSALDVTSGKCVKSEVDFLGH